jgi:hypothetical protein
VPFKMRTWLHRLTISFTSSCDACFWDLLAERQPSKQGEDRVVVQRAQIAVLAGKTHIGPAQSQRVRQTSVTARITTSNSL